MYFVRAGMAWMTISSPLSKMRTTVSNRRACASKPRRSSIHRPYIFQSQSSGARRLSAVPDQRSENAAATSSADA